MPTHGSMTKAGKVRKATPKIEPKPKVRPFPRVNNRKRYQKLLEKPVTQKAKAL
ncbi:MAG: 30S ribosomal protein S30e [Acidilobaceae archaeon]|nr:30S ribosomal protein S30e [Acidilobaceae archaeon]MCX8166159.1 30S ribosomal protein S30e [Acidilobaceae archaeon]MDW7974797.1 30S ribosomal protein S30e [Sulfolobales archaeon]